MEKVYAGATNEIKIICPKCGLEKNMNVFKFKDTHKRLKAKCKCGELFRVELEFRRYYRKEVRLAGEYSVQEKDERVGVIIKEISVRGIRFLSLKPHFISRNDTVELKFTLDNPMRTEIQTPIEVKWIIDQNVGGQFLDPRSLEKVLVPYLKA